MRRLLVCSLLAVAACRIERAPAGRPGGGFAIEPDSQASAEVYAVLRGHYAAVTARDWRLLATHFAPRGTLTSFVAPAPDSAAAPRTVTIEEFVARAGTVDADVFADAIASADVVTYGGIADAWVTWRAQVGSRPDSVSVRYGIDAFHLVRSEGRWRIASVTTQPEVHGRPLGPRATVRR